MPRCADDLAVGEQVTYRGQRTTILAPAAPWVDRFGRPMVKLYARREDTGAVGFIHYGADALADMAEMIDEDGSHNVACECPQCQEEETGAVAPRQCGRCRALVARYPSGWAHMAPGSGDHAPEL